MDTKKHMHRKSAVSAWITFDYEKDMFRSLLSYFRPGHTEFLLLSRSLRFAAAESLLLHMRIIVDVLLSKDNSPDTIRLSDLLPGFKPSNLDDLKKAYGTSRKKNSPCWVLNKMLAHPTVERLASFDYTPMVALLGPTIESVIIEVQEERLKRQSV